METTFTRTDTKVIKGVAVLLMLMHHLFYFPDNRPYSMPEVRQTLPNFMGQGLETMLGIFGVICVPIFFFLAGYGLYLQTRRDGFRLEMRILAVYTQYGRSFSSLSPSGSCFSATRAIIARRRLTAMYLSSGACRSCSRHCSA